MAGLAAGDILARAGHDVVILEAQNRAGGRIHTLHGQFAEGLYVEAGANRFFDTHDLTMSYCRRFELPLIDFQGGKQPAKYWIDLHAWYADSETPKELDLTAEEQSLEPHELVGRYVATWLEKMGDPVRDFPPPDLMSLDEVSYAEFLRRQGASRGAIRLIGADFNVGSGVEGASALWMLRNLALDRHRRKAFKVMGGNDRLPLALARLLSDRIRYGAVVVGLKQDLQGVEVRYRQSYAEQVERFDRVVCTLPFPVLRGLTISPGFSAGKERAIDQVPYASMVKVFLQSRHRFWEKHGTSGFATTDIPQTEIWNVTEGETGRRGVLLAYVGGRMAQNLSSLPEHERLRIILERLAPVFPELRENYEGGFTKAWDIDPWALGAGAWYGVGQIGSLYPHVASVEGLVHFAGDHASPWPGWVQGALHSAHRAAQEVHEA